MIFGNRDQAARQGREQIQHRAEFVRQIESQIECDLVVARACGVQFGAGRTGDLDQPTLNCQMNIFVGQIETEAAGFDLAFDLLQSLDDPIGVGIADQAGLRQHAPMGNRAPNVVPEQAAVKRQRSGERLHLGQTGGFKSAADQIARHAWGAFLHANSRDRS